MRKVKRWRYYCDFCKKGGASGGHMSRHEKSCTVNPNRICRMCQFADQEQPSMVDMLEALKIASITKEIEKFKIGNDLFESETYKIENEKKAVEKLREVANGCPMCMLAAIRQTGYPAPIFSSFDFKKEKKIFWTEFRDSEMIDYGGY